MFDPERNQEQSFPAPLSGGEPEPEEVTDHAALSSETFSRRLEAAVVSGMGNHTPGTNSDVHYLAEFRTENRALAQICDGVTGRGLDQKCLTGLWLARPLARAAEAIDLGRELTPEQLQLAVDSELMGLEAYLPFIRPEDVQRYLKQALAERRVRLAPPYSMEAIEEAFVAAKSETLQAVTQSPCAKVLATLALELRDLPQQFRRDFAETFPFLRPLSTIVGAIERRDEYLLYWAGDSRAGFFTQDGFLPTALTPPDSDSLGLAKFVSMKRDKIHLPLSFLTVRKADLPPGANLVLWSDGSYIDRAMEVLEQNLKGHTLPPARLAQILGHSRDVMADELRNQGREDLIDDHTIIVISAS